MVIFCNTGKNALTDAIVRAATFYVRIGTGDNPEDAGDTDLETPILDYTGISITDFGTFPILTGYPSFNIDDNYTLSEVGLFDSEYNLIIRHLLDPTQAVESGDTVSVAFILTWTGGA